MSIFKTKNVFESIKLITFDITGTLLKFRKNPVQIYIEKAAEYGVIVLDRQQLAVEFKQQWARQSAQDPHFGSCWKKWWSEFVLKTFNNTLCDGARPEKLQLLADELIQRFSTDEYWEVRPFAKNLLENLHQQNKGIIHLGVISNFDPRLHKILEATRLSKYFDFVITSHECQISKPDPKIFQIGYNLGKIFDPSLEKIEILHIGDNYELDFVGATTIGWNACLVGEKRYTEDHMSLDTTTNDKKPCIIFPTLKSLHDEFKILKIN